MEFHEYANVFPLLEGEELQELADDIATNGLLEPIWVYEDKILDGRNRYKACLMAGVEPEMEEYEGDDPVSFVISLNLIRRHLSPVQRATVGVAILPMMQAEAERRSLANLKQGDEVPDVENLPARGRSRDQAGQKVGVSGSMVDAAATIKETRPDIFKKMQQGKVPSMPVAEELINVAPSAIDGVLEEYERLTEKSGQRAARAWVRAQSGVEEEDQREVSASVEIERGYQLVSQNLDRAESAELHAKWAKKAAGLLARHEEKSV